MKSKLDSQKISSENVGRLMENLWLRHQAGLKQRSNNVYMVEFPPPTPEEIAKMRGEEKHDGLDEEASQYSGIV